MTTYIILTRFSPAAFRDPGDIKDLASRVKSQIREECAGLEWIASYATLGRFDVVDVVQSDDPRMIERAAMIIRASGNGTTETMVATPWKEFLAAL